MNVILSKGLGKQKNAHTKIKKKTHKKLKLIEFYGLLDNKILELRVVYEILK